MFCHFKIMLQGALYNFVQKNAKTIKRFLRLSIYLMFEFRAKKLGLKVCATKCKQSILNSTKSAHLLLLFFAPRFATFLWPLLRFEQQHPITITLIRGILNNYCKY